MKYHEIIISITMKSSNHPEIPVKLKNPGERLSFQASRPSRPSSGSFGRTRGLGVERPKWWRNHQQN